MSVYMIIDVQVTDRNTYAEYVEKVAPIVEKYGGRYLVRGGDVKVLTGDWHPERIIILEFPSAEHLRRWLTSPEYAPLAALREKSTRAKAVAVEGLSTDIR